MINGSTFLSSGANQERRWMPDQVRHDDENMNPLAPFLPWFDLFGIAVFAASGALAAARHRQTLVTFAFFALVTGVGGGTVRDMMLQRVPTVLRSELYAIPALLGAALTVLASRLGIYGLAAAVVAAAACFIVRMVGVRFGLNAPRPPVATRPRR